MDRDLFLHSLLGVQVPGKGQVCWPAGILPGGWRSMAIVQESCVQEVFSFLGWEVDLVAIFTTNNTWMCRT